MLTPPAFRTEGQPLPIDAFIAELDSGLMAPGRDRRNHPFVKAVEAGTATKNQIAGWRHQITQWAHPTNKLVGVLWSRCQDDDLSAMLFENIEEENAGKTSGMGGHIPLNYRFIEELGWDKARQAKDVARPETWALRHWFEIALTCRPPVDGIAALSFTAERLNPEVLGRVYRGMQKNYDLSEEALKSLAVHASHVEEEHGSLGPVAFERYARTVYDQDRVRFVVLHTAEVYYNMYNVWQYY